MILPSAPENWRILVGRSQAIVTRCRKARSRLICLEPNIKFLPGEYWDFWDHHLPLSETSLAELLRLAGFVIDAKVGRFLPYSMSQGSAPPVILLRIFLKCRFLWPVFGKQFLVIARKRGVGPVP